MGLKDYYKILNVSPKADEREIKKAFRFLALQYHPDKTGGNKYKEALYREIQEAYETLSHKQSREEYNYKRWYTRSLGKTFTEEAVTPEMLLKESAKLAGYVKSTNNLHLDFDILSHNARKILSDDNVGILKQFNNTGINSAIVNHFTAIAEQLPVKYLDPILSQLRLIAGNDQKLNDTLEIFLREKKSSEYWEKRKGWLVFAAVLVICVLMYLYGSRT